jgi:hypothetical protein
VLFVLVSCSSQAYDREQVRPEGYSNVGYPRNGEVMERGREDRFQSSRVPKYDYMTFSTREIRVIMEKLVNFKAKSLSFLRFFSLLSRCARDLPSLLASFNRLCCALWSKFGALRHINSRSRAGSSPMIDASFAHY